MTRAALLVFAPAIAALAVLVASGCASVLGVDKTYTLADASAGDGPSSDATRGPSPVFCGATLTCTAPGEECCYGADGGLSCSSTSLSDPCPDGTDIPCDDPSDCDAGACFLTVDTAMDILGTRCAAACASGDYLLCDPARPSCPQGTCNPLSVQPQPPFSPTSFHACQ